MCTVPVPAAGACHCTDQVALADEIAWALFGPLAARELGLALFFLGAC